VISRCFAENRVATLPLSAIIHVRAIGAPNKKESKMGGHALSHKRAEHFLIPPANLVIIGFDTKHVQGEHPLWRADCKNEANADLVNSIRKHGIIQPIRARKLPKSDAIESEHLSLSGDEYAEVVVGRERVKAARVLADEGLNILVPALLWPVGAPVGEIIGAANAENYQRKTEGVVAVAEHVYMQLRAEGYFDGNERDALKGVAVSTGFSVQRIRNLLAFREDERLVREVRACHIGGEAALAIATLPEKERGEQLAKVLADPTNATIEQVRERVRYAKAAIPDGKTNGKNGHVGTKEGGVSSLGISKPLQKRIVEAQSALSSNERLDPLVIKTLKVCAGLASPSTVPGLTKALKALGL